VFEIFEKGFVTEQDFREFTFTCFALLHTRNNPGFFKVPSSSKRLPMRCAGKSIADRERVDDSPAESWDVNTPVDNFHPMIASHGAVCAPRFS